jgi:hypothetical protein
MDLGEEALRRSLRPLDRAPGLYRLNGCGTTMLGRYYDPTLSPKFYSLRWFTFFLIPILPLGIYLVSKPNSTYFFHASIRRRELNALYRRGFGTLVWSGVGETIFVLGSAFALIILIGSVLTLIKH